MLSEKQILSIREHLERAQNPLFFFDNDADGLCSYVLLRKFCGKGKGVAVRSHPDVDERYVKKAQELNADYIFVLDRPVLGEKFVSEVKKLQLPVVWIDHHDMEGKDYSEKENIFTFNPVKEKKKSSEPVSYWCYKVSNRREDLWLAVMGCIADHYLPDFVEDFEEVYPDLWGKNVEKPFDAYFKTEIGEMARVLGFALKDSVSHVVQLQNFLVQCKTPGDFSAGLDSNKPFAKKYKDLKKKYDKLVSKAKENVGDNLLFFNYGGDMSISSEISNELCYLHPDKIVIVAFSSGPITNVSLRGKNVRKILLEILPDFDNATGGGHEDAVGSRIQTKDLERFKEAIEQRLI